MQDITISQIVAKRRQLWAKNKPEREQVDREFIEASARKILETPALVQEVQERPYLLIEATFTIVDKAKQTVPFFFNEVQQDFIQQFEKYGTGRPYFVLKGRQQGFTSLITAIQLSYAIVQRNFAGFTIADCGDNTMSIFNDKARMLYARLPEILKPTEKFNNRNELFFEKLNSSWRIATATDNVGRSRTLNFVHYSEVAFYEISLSALQSGIGEATTENAVQIYETTANGFNEAKDLWDGGSCINLFYEWWRTSEYASTDYQFLENGDEWLRSRVKLLQEKGLTKEQLTWYCKKYFSYLDKDLIKQEYPISPEEAFISSGSCIFDKEKIVEHIEKVRNVKPIKTGYFDYKRVTEVIKDSEGKEVYQGIKLADIKWVEDINGYIKIYEEPQTKINKDGIVTHKAPYVIGGDTSGLGLDFNTAKVINNITRNSAATLRKQVIDDDLYAEQLYCLGMYYHEALIGIEVNFSLQPTKYLADKLQYKSLYVRERLDNIQKIIVKSFGFETNQKTRPVIISDLVALIREDVTIEPDIATLKEMLTFIKNENGRAEAQEGSHDDLIMALAIAHFISGQQTSSWIERKVEEDNFIKENFNLEPQKEVFMNWDEF